MVRYDVIINVLNFPKVYLALTMIHVQLVTAVLQNNVQRFIPLVAKEDLIQHLLG